MELRAPAAAEDAVVSLDQRGVSVPGLGTKRFNRRPSNDGDAFAMGEP
ncbi:MAG TPA: hypothetical protein VM848_07735 [Acidimicrobiia bacterium]|nr:hypothetical protein [Acidimicrobiia bacterium]